MRVSAILILLLACQTVYPQSEIVFKFSLKDHTLKKRVSYPLIDSVITIKRKIISESEFEDFGILCWNFPGGCSVKFKVDEKMNWFVFVKKRWHKFFDASAYKLQRVDIEPGKLLMPITGAEIAGGKYSLVCYKIVDPDPNVQEHDNDVLYWFHPQFGLVIIESRYFFWVRDDFSKVME